MKLANLSLSQHRALNDPTISEQYLLFWTFLLYHKDISKGKRFKPVLSGCSWTLPWWAASSAWWRSRCFSTSTSSSSWPPCCWQERPTWRSTPAFWRNRERCTEKIRPSMRRSFREVEGKQKKNLDPSFRFCKIFWRKLQNGLTTVEQHISNHVLTYKSCPKMISLEKW